MTTPAALTAAAVVVGALLVAITLIGLRRADETLRAHHRVCPRAHEWLGYVTFCDICGGWGRIVPPPAEPEVSGIPAQRQPEDDRARHRLNDTRTPTNTEAGR
jgi:hypothetical protein